MVEVDKITSIIGPIPGRIASHMDLDRAIHRGLPARTVDRLSEAIAPKEPAFKFMIVAKSTLSRRLKTKEPLTPEEGEKVARLARVWAVAKEVWRDEADARRFLETPHPLLDGRPPREVADSEIGAREVENILGRLRFGSAA
ncbi:MAG: antitoxin Xre/MbcA/ParS toxin-binding domain-containing protein [Alphaproteobacteria bacterium]